MANTTSGTYIFDKTLSIDEVIEEVVFKNWYIRNVWK
jgi:hypothetical protein